MERINCELCYGDIEPRHARISWNEFESVFRAGSIRLVITNTKTKWLAFRNWLRSVIGQPWSCPSQNVIISDDGKEIVFKIGYPLEDEYIVRFATMPNDFISSIKNVSDSSPLAIKIETAD